MTSARLLLASVFVVGTGSAALAQHRHPAPAYGSETDAEIIARRTAEAQREPGVTQELAPDARQTATGGPSGGVPGFSGH